MADEKTNIRVANRGATFPQAHISCGDCISPASAELLYSCQFFFTTRAPCRNVIPICGRNMGGVTRPGPALTCGQVRCLRNLKVLDAGQVLYDVLAVSIPRIDAVSETGAIVYRHFCLPQSSSASRFTLSPGMQCPSCLSPPTRSPSRLNRHLACARKPPRRARSHRRRAR